MSKRPFDKPPTTYIKQVEILKQRGMLFSNEANAAFLLEHLNYYRVGAYWLPFEQDHATHRFKAETSFEAVMVLYEFDRNLRLLVMDAIERVEVSVRSHWAYELAHRHGTHAHLESSLAENVHHWQKNLDDLTKEVERSDEVFIQHLQKNYSEDLPPVWAVCEVMSLGLLSRWYKNLKPMSTRKAIAHSFALTQPVLSSWLHHLTMVRNICAHHSRLWNREFIILPMMPQHQPAELIPAFVPKSRKLYNTLLILCYLVKIISPDSDWRQKLLALLEVRPQALPHMGFPPDWQTQAIWSNPVVVNPSETAR